MNSLCLKILSLLVLCFATQLLAEETPNDFRSPGDMTVEERTTMMRVATQYDTCVYKEAIKRIGDFGDIRDIANTAMSSCQNHLDDLKVVIAGFGFDPGFGEGFSRRTSQRAVRKLLPELAIRKTR